MYNGFIHLERITRINKQLEFWKLLVNFTSNTGMVLRFEKKKIHTILRDVLINYGLVIRVY